jgi:hypothetical protein
MTMEQSPSVTEPEAAIEELTTRALDVGIRPDLAEAIVNSARYDSIRQEIVDLWRFVLPDDSVGPLLVADRIEVRALHAAAGQLSQVIADQTPAPRERPFALVPDTARGTTEREIAEALPLLADRFGLVLDTPTTATPEEPTC